MLAHFLTDVILRTFIPLSAMPEGETGRILAIAGKVVAILVTIVWTGRIVIAESSRHHIQRVN